MLLFSGKEFSRGFRVLSAENGADVNHVAKDGTTALMWPAERGYKERIAMLLQREIRNTISFLGSASKDISGFLFDNLLGFMSSPQRRERT